MRPFLRSPKVSLCPRQPAKHWQSGAFFSPPSPHPNLNYRLGKEYFDVAALNTGSSTIAVAKEFGKDYAIVPILTQVEYPANGSSAVVTLPEGVEVLSFDKAEPASPSLRNSILNQSYHETAAVISGFFARAAEDFTVIFTYSDPDGNTQSQTLTVRIGEGSDQQLQKMVSDYRASILADRPTPSQLTGRITQAPACGLFTWQMTRTLFPMALSVPCSMWMISGTSE